MGKSIGAATLSFYLSSIFLSGFRVQFPDVVVVRHRQEAPQQISIHDVGGVAVDAAKSPTAKKDQKDENESIRQSQL